MKIKGVIFDMDGVLLDTEILYQRFWIEALRSFGFPATKEHILQMRSLTGKAAEQKLKGFFGENLDYAAVKAERIKRMEHYIDEKGIEIKTGADRILPFLKENGYKIALATSSPLERARKYLSGVGLFEYFDEYVCGGMVNNSKPAPDIYLLACQKLNLPPEQCIAVEDSPNGAISAIRAGCQTVMIPDLSPSPPNLTPHLLSTPQSLTDLIGLIKNITSISNDPK